jgi:hypothetical protein
MATKIHTAGDLYLYDSGVEGVLSRKQQGLYYMDWMYKSFPAYASAGYIERDGNTSKNRNLLSLVSEIQRVVLTPYPLATLFQWISGLREVVAVGRLLVLWTTTLLGS